MSTENDNKNNQPGVATDGVDEQSEPSLEEIEQNIDKAIEEQQALEQARIQARREKIKADDDQFKELSLVEDEDEDFNSTELHCLNCGTPLKGAYCYECGQPDRNYIRFFPRVLWEMINEAFDFDSKIFKTIIPLMFSPGRLTLEYIAGRRATYINPLRLYIVTSLVFFIALAFSELGEDLVINDGESEGVKSRQTIAQIDNASPGQEVLEPATTAEADEIVRFQSMLDSLQAKQANGFPVPDQSIVTLQEALSDGIIQDEERGLFINDQDEFNVKLDDGAEWHPISNPIDYDLDISPELNQEINNYLWQLKGKLYEVQDDPTDLIEEVLDKFPQLMFLLLPIFALLLKIVYIFKKRYYMEHLITALHSHSFIFLSLLLVFLFSLMIEELVSQTWLAETFSWGIVAILVWMPVNLFMQQKRIYAQGKFMTFVKFSIVGISYFFLLMLTAFGAFILGLGSL